MSRELRHTHTTRLIWQVHHSRSIEMRAEVGVTSRPTILLSGVDTVGHPWSWDFQFDTLKKAQSGLLLRAHAGSVLTLSGVKVAEGGAAFPAIAAMRGGSFVLPVVSISARASASVRGSVFMPVYGHGVVAKAGVVEGNLIYRCGHGVVAMTCWWAPVAAQAHRRR